MPPSIAGLTNLVEVGRGGFGTVFSAYEERFGRQVAVKIIRHAGVGRDVVARFERECLALGALSGHPNIVAVYDQGVTEDGAHYLVMEFLGGGSFAERLEDHGPARPADVVVWGGALASALETAHQSGIVHRDVKPENILLSDYGVPKLVDFGIARMRSAYETRSGFVTATLNHAAPEIVAGASVSPSADVYSLASVLFTMLIGRAPFERPDEDSLAPLIARIATAPPPDVRGLGVPDDLAVVLERGLAKDPKERFPTAAAFGEALQAVAGENGMPVVEVPVADPADVAEAAAVIAEGPETPSKQAVTASVPPDRLLARPEEPADDEPRRSRWPWVAAAVAVLLAIAGTATALAMQGDHPSTESGDPTTSPTLALLPVAEIRGADRCRGFVCEMSAHAEKPLPPDAEWLWTVDGKVMPTTAATMTHRFRDGGRHTVTLVSRAGSQVSEPGTAVVRLASWPTSVRIASTDQSSIRGELTARITSAGHPGCLAGSVQLLKKSNGVFTESGRAVRATKGGVATFTVARGSTYRVRLAPQDVRNAVCEGGVSSQQYVAPLAQSTETASPDPTPQDTSSPEPNPGPGPKPTH